MAFLFWKKKKGEEPTPEPVAEEVVAEVIEEVVPEPVVEVVAEKPKPAPKPKPAAEKVQCDETGLPIPKEIIPLWQRGHEAIELLTFVSTVRTRLQKAQKEKDLLL